MFTFKRWESLSKHGDIYKAKTASRSNSFNFKFEKIIEVINYGITFLKTFFAEKIDLKTFTKTNAKEFYAEGKKMIIKYVIDYLWHSVQDIFK